MMKISTFLAVLALSTAGFTQTTVYETGQVAGDPWTGWSTPVVTNCSGSVNMANVYQFSGSSGASYTFETYRQFTINSNDIDVYLAATTQNTTVSVEYSTDNVSYTQIGTQNWAAGYAQSTLVIPTYDAGGISSFYLKIVVSGTFSSPSNTQLNTFKIDAVLNSNEMEEFTVGSNVLYANGLLQVMTTLKDYTVSIFDINGKLIASKLNLKQADLNEFESGVYFVNIVSKEGERKTVKILHN